MGNNLIHNYVTNMNNQQSPQQTKKAERSYFGVPSVTSTLDSFDQETDKLIKPLDGKGHLVRGGLLRAPKEFIRDTVYTAKALVDGARGKANDHQLGKLNDLGLKLSGIAIATYLMTRRTTPKTKAMEFIGFGAFLASMALWPKLALEIPARLIHGFNFRKQYVDEQGRKKYVSQDPNYIPFDLYKGDRKSEDLDVIGDRAGIRRDIPNRQEVVKDHMRKVSVQNNTMWMLTSGFAVPIMTALACNRADKYITPYAEKYSNKKANKQIDEVAAYLQINEDNAANMGKDARKAFEKNVLKTTYSNGKEKATATDKLLETLKGGIIKKADIANLSDTLAAGFDAEMKDAARADIENLIGGEKYVANASSADRLATAIHSKIAATDPGIAANVKRDALKAAAEQGMVRGAVRDLLTSVGTDIIDPTGRFSNVSDNFKCREVADIDFFAETEATKNMSPADRLAHNIKSIIMKVHKEDSAQNFVPGMGELEKANPELKASIDARLSHEADKIAKNFYEGNLTIGSGRENYVRLAINDVYKKSAGKTPKAKTLFAQVGDIISEETANHRGFVINDSLAEKISTASKTLGKFNAVDNILADAAHFKVEKASETVVANSWNEVTNLLVSELKLTPEELKIAAKNKEYSNELLAKKLEQICSNDTDYENFITKLGKKMVELDEKLDKPNSPNDSSQMMSKLESGIKRNCTEAGESLESLGMQSMKDKMTSSKSKSMGINAGSIMNSKVERIHSRVNGVHGTYMRLLQTAEFMHRANGYEKDTKPIQEQIEKILLKEEGKRSQSEKNDLEKLQKQMKEISIKYGFSESHESNKEIIAKGKELLLDAHTNKYYTKMGLHNNKSFFKSLLSAMFRPHHGEPGQHLEWNQGWNEITSSTINKLNEIKPDGKTPRRVFEGTKELGTKLQEHMNQMYASMGSIQREIVKGEESILTDASVGVKDARACERFDLLGKSLTDMFHDTLKQKSNSSKWMKTFAPALGIIYGLTVISQFFFGKKDPDIKA